MYIKQVIIKGFKSYKEVATEDFSPKVNCVVGANGSGKSNFFHAIRFVISDVFHNLCSEDRQGFLHEGAGDKVLSAYVEIVFDNSDNRIPIDKKEVRLRRTISTRTDEYILDGKHITKTDVINLLECVGFSHSNPYHFVYQGKITSLSVMKDSELLDLLKEIGGCRVYKKCRYKSLKLMQNIANRRNLMILDKQYADEKLRELDEEKAELKRYQQLDKQRKSLKYTIYDKEVNNACRQLAEVDKERNAISEKLVRKYNSSEVVKEEIKKLGKLFKGLTREVQDLSREREAIEKQRAEAFKKHKEVELDVSDLEEEIMESVRAKDEAGKLLEVLNREIQESTDELNSIRSLYNDQVKQEEDTKKGIMLREKQLSILYKKQDCETKFCSKAARDELLRKYLDKYNEILCSYLKQENLLKGEIIKLERDVAAQTQQAKVHEAEIAALETQIIGQCIGLNQHKAKRDELHDKRKSLWRTERELNDEIKRLKAKVVEAKKALDYATPGDIRRGISCMRRICREYNISGVYGSIIELLECNESLFTAVEVTAGDSLFHVVVESDEISTKVIRHLNAEKGGIVTFIPLNRVKAPHVTYPSSSDALPILKKLKYSPNYDQAFRQVFARTMICRDLDVATRVASTDGLDCITAEGDQVSRKGGLTGGFYDKAGSKLKLMNIIRQNDMLITVKEKELQNVKSELQALDEEISEIINQMQKEDAELAHERSKLEQLKQDAADANKHTQNNNKALEKKLKLLSNVQTRIEQVKADIATKKDEMRTEPVDHLTQEERHLQARLNPEILDLKGKLVACRANRVETETRKVELEANLSTNLVRRKQELEAEKQSSATETLRAKAEAKSQELQGAKVSVEEAERQLKRVLKVIEDRNKELKKINKKKNELKKKYELKRKSDLKACMKSEKTRQNEDKNVEQLICKRNILLAKKEEYSKKIRELGSLSSNLFQVRHKDKSIEELHKMLHKCNEQLKQFSAVNMKALDQYANFAHQNEQLQKRCYVPV